MSEWVGVRLRGDCDFSFAQLVGSGSPSESMCLSQRMALVDLLARLSIWRNELEMFVVVHVARHTCTRVKMRKSTKKLEQHQRSVSKFKRAGSDSGRRLQLLTVSKKLKPEINIPLSSIVPFLQITSNVSERSGRQLLTGP